MNYFIDAFRRFADFKGRATRKQYWMFVLSYVILYVVALIIDAFLDGEIIAFIVLIAIFIPSLSLGARRLHDTGRSGWWQLLYIIPFGVFVLLALYALDGEPDVNKYGENPKGISL